MTKTPRSVPLYGTPAYRQTWRIVDGAVATAMHDHPEYFTGVGRRRAREAIVKRVTGALQGYAEQSAKVRSGSSPADDTNGAQFQVP